MAEVRLPRYMRAKVTKGGKAYYWEPPTWARGAQRHGRICPVVATPLGMNIAEAWEKAENLNEAFEGWRRGNYAAGPAVGTVEHLFAWYQKQRKFTKNRQKTQNDYRKIMGAVCDLPMKVGRFGERQAAKITPEIADQLYEKFSKRGERQALYVVQVLRAVWNLAERYSTATGISKNENPFAGMGVTYRVKTGNRPTSRQEYELYCAKARELNFQSMATAAALCFELVQRVSDAFSIPDAPPGPGTEARPGPAGIRWEDYLPGERITVIQAKTGKRVTVPLVDVLPNGERIPLYPELEEQLGRSLPADPRGPIVVEERNGLPYSHRRMSTVHRRICEAAGLPKSMTFTGFRHGGATEIGDAGEVDIRPISGHAKLDTTAIYNKINEEKARRIAVRRREHIATISAGATEEVDD